MDEYKQYLYDRLPNTKDADPGDISEQLAVRKRLQCKSFKWFMTKIAFDLTKHYPPVEPLPVGTGDIRPELDHSLCVDARNAAAPKPVLLAPCARDFDDDDDNLQKLQLSYKDDIRLDAL